MVVGVLVWCFRALVHGVLCLGGHVGTWAAIRVLGWQCGRLDVLWVLGWPYGNLGGHAGTWVAMRKFGMSCGSLRSHAGSQAFIRMLEGPQGMETALCFGLLVTK